MAYQRNSFEQSDGLGQSKSPIPFWLRPDAADSDDKNSVGKVCAPILEPSKSLIFQRPKNITVKQTFQCSICNKIFSNSSAIAKHKLTHSNERKYVCGTCNKAFKRQDHLNGHLLTHKDKKPHACTLCEKSYSDTRSLRRHYENVHAEKLRQLKEERLCNNSDDVLSGVSNGGGTAITTATTTSANFSHSINSTRVGDDGTSTMTVLWNPLDEQGKVECDWCGKKFKSQSALNGHMRLHGGYNVRREEGPPALVAMLPAAGLQEGVDPAAGQQVSSFRFAWQTLDAASSSLSQSSTTDLLNTRSEDLGMRTLFTTHVQTVSNDLPATITTESSLERSCASSGGSTVPMVNTDQPLYEPITPNFEDKSCVKSTHFFYQPDVANYSSLQPRFSIPNHTSYSLSSSATISLPERKNESHALFKDPVAPNLGHRSKHRPAPLIIPPHVSTHAFVSRLRSPRIFKPNCSAPGFGLGSSSPPPYTPPPMLSPMRQGSGLFWHVKSNLAASCFGLGMMSALTPSLGAPLHPTLATQKSWPQVASAQQVVDIEKAVLTGSVSIDEENEDLDSEVESSPPATDILPKINLGDQFQAKLPDLRPRAESLHDHPHATLVWDPQCEMRLSEEEVTNYLYLSCSSAVPEGGLNQEYALHLLHCFKGDLRAALRSLLEADCANCCKEEAPLNDYIYAETEFWSLKDATGFTELLYENEKDFFLVSKQLQQLGIPRSVKHCVEFYYIWKHTWSHEYKMLNTRWKRRRVEQLANADTAVPQNINSTSSDAIAVDSHLEQSSLYNLRSRAPMPLHTQYASEGVNDVQLDSLASKQIDNTSWSTLVMATKS